MMIADLKSFCARLDDAENAKCAENAHLSPYLMRHLFLPFMRGEKVTLDSLDYDAFETEDLDDLFRYLDEAGGEGERLNHICSALHRCVPAARKTRRFC